MKKITAPVPGLNGPGVGSLEFRDSVAVTDNEAVIAYCQSAGYTVQDADDNEVGDAIRDAAVNPQPSDHLPPVNAGEADPHGPAVVSPDLGGHTPPTEPAEPLAVPEGSLEDRVTWVSEGESQQIRGDRASAVYAQETEAGGDQDHLEALGALLRDAVYVDPAAAGDSES